MTETTLPSAFLALSCCALRAQDGFFSDWLDRSDQAKADQPHWMTPLVTVTPRLEQELRSDLELLFNLPPYLVHNAKRCSLSFLSPFRPDMLWLW
jgi:hypothetical protein